MGNGETCRMDEVQPRYRRPRFALHGNLIWINMAHSAVSDETFC